MDRYAVEFAELMLGYMIKVCNRSSFPLPHSNLLTYIFKAFHVSLEDQDHHGIQIPMINETLKSLRFASLRFGLWKDEEEIMTDNIKTPKTEPCLEIICPT